MLRTLRGRDAHGPNDMRIVIFGTGGAGGYFGAGLARAGEDVVFIARGEHLRAIQKDGLRIETIDGDFVVRAVATENPLEIGKVDVVLVGVKAWQVRDVARAMAPMLKPDTLVVPLQNGVDAASDLVSVLGIQNVLNGLCGTISRVVAPGHILSIGKTNFIKFAELDNRPSDRVESLRKAFVHAEINVEVPTDIDVAVWEKFIFVTPYGGVGAVTRSPAGVIRTLPETRRMVESGMKEILAVAGAKRISLPDGIIDKTMGLLDSLDSNATTSLQRDIIAGKPSELDAWTGAVVRMSKEVKVPTPLHEFIYHSLLPSELSARKQEQMIANAD